jgi:predicted dehydrogenase
MNKLKVGIIGAGKMGFLHAGIFNTLELSELSSIAEKKKIILEGLKKYLSEVNIYENYEEMIEKENLDAVVITTPVFLHKRMIEKSMKFNLHIFVEKPMALNHMECQSILSKSYEKKTMVGYCRRFMGTYNFVNEIIKSETLGRVNYFHSQLFVSQVFSAGKGWLYNPEMSGGGVVIDLGSHAINLIQYLFGDIESVQAFGKSLFNKEVEDFASINLHLRNNLFGSLQISWSVRHYRLPEFKIEIHFEKGIIITTEKYVRIFSEIENKSIKKGWNTFYKQNLTKDVPVDLGGPEYTLEDMHFLKCILQDEMPFCDFYEGAKTNLVIDKIYSSIKNLRTEKINPEN